MYVALQKFIHQKFSRYQYAYWYVSKDNYDNTDPNYTELKRVQHSIEQLL